MAKPKENDSRSCRLGLVSLGVALVSVAGLAVCVMCLDAKRQEQMGKMSDQLDMLRQLVDTMQKQLDRHEDKINSTLHTKSTVTSEPAEVVYEDEYDYDDEESSYEYEDDEEPNPKATVKRTTVLSESTSSGNSTEAPNRATTSHSHGTARTRRDVRSQAVPVKEERYVPSTPHLKDIFGYRNKSEGLRIYATYFGNAVKKINSREQSRHLKNSITEPLGNYNEPAHDTKAFHQNAQKNVHHLRSSGVQEQRRAEETVVRLRHGGRNRNVHLGDVELLDRDSAEEFAPQKPTEHHHNLLAAHFVGDASTYNIRDHSHYYGNNIMFHPHGIFRDWMPSNWMLQLGTISDFLLLNGKLSIQKPGIYFVYAQVYYAATHDRCGFHIKHNGEEVAQCMIMSAGRTVKRNTCFTAVILHLQKSDLLWISEVEGYRNTSFKGSHSFFGLIQLKAT